MSLLKAELNSKINGIPDARLAAIKPLIDMLYDDTLVVERVPFSELEPYEQDAMLKTRAAFENGEETIDFEDYLKERGIDIDN